MLRLGKIIDAGFPPVAPPAILGYDVAGTVEEVGTGVTNYKRGDRMYLPLSFRPLISSISWADRRDEDHSGFQQYALVAAAPNSTAKFPDNISEDEAATLPTALNTAHVALTDESGLGYPCPFEDNPSFGKGKAFLVLGGSSTVGLVGIHLILWI